MALPKFKLWSLPLWGGKKEREKTSKVSSSKESGVMEIERVRFPWKETRIASASKNKNKWNNGGSEEREEDVVIVAEDEICLSERDWSIGWLEPHSPDFLSDDQTDDSFAVLVPCYKNYTPTITATTTTTTSTRVSLDKPPDAQLLNTINNLTAHPFPEGKSRMEQWLSSLQNF